MAHRQQHDNYAQPQQQYYDQGRPQQRQQQQYQNYDNHYDQQQYYDYDYGYDQGGNEQWNNGHYDQQQGGWGNAQQQGGYQDVNGYSRSAQPNQGRRHPPQDQYYQEEAYNEPY